MTRTVLMVGSLKHSNQDLFRYRGGAPPADAYRAEQLSRVVHL